MSLCLECVKHEQHSIQQLLNHLYFPFLWCHCKLAIPCACNWRLEQMGRLQFREKNLQARNGCAGPPPCNSPSAASGESLAAPPLPVGESPACQWEHLPSCPGGASKAEAAFLTKPFPSQLDLEQVPRTLSITRKPQTKHFRTRADHKSRSTGEGSRDHCSCLQRLVLPGKQIPRK